MDIAHFGFILASYLVTAAVLGALVAWVVVDGRRQRAALDDLERRGVRRRHAEVAAAIGREPAR
ncbi:heme exporter protein D [Tepidamorphus gemmatus]|jgi:heme exporter protein D|uniref:Heme exporter protein D n=1 Tax=Tepidamorphus gemmatus TaxID=747076 RepID=A0A4R3MDT2_9HYPH|nr:heme exporter protein CcmD [Tepidamorphus gemmatus]TCT11810.1 heme exporter protein D [Tepidamorphus gemmatus]